MRAREDRAGYRSGSARSPGSYRGWRCSSMCGPPDSKSDPSDVRVRHHRVALRVLQHLRGQYGAAVQESRALAGVPLWGEGVHCTEFDRQSAVGMAGVLGDFSGLASILHQALTVKVKDTPALAPMKVRATARRRVWGLADGPRRLFWSRRSTRSPSVGAEIRKIRPAVVISSDAVGRLPIKIVAPVTEWTDHFR